MYYIHLVIASKANKALMLLDFSTSDMNCYFPLIIATDLN